MELISMNYHDHPFRCIHSYIVSIAPEKTRANHVHRKKEEWISIVTGKVLVHLVDIETNETLNVHLDSESENYKIIYISPGVAHAIQNTDMRESSIIVFSTTPEDKEDTIPYEDFR